MRPKATPALVGTAPTGELAWDSFEIAAARYGLLRWYLEDGRLADRPTRTTKKR